MKDIPRTKTSGDRSVFKKSVVFFKKCDTMNKRMSYWCMAMNLEVFYGRE